MLNSEYIDKLRTYLKSTETAEFPFSTLAVQHLADGVTVTQDSLGEYDTYFDRDKWELTIPEIWENSPCPPALESFNLGVLQGLGQVPAVRSFPAAVPYAMRHLKPKNGTTWNNPIPAVQKEP